MAAPQSNTMGKRLLQSDFEKQIVEHPLSASLFDDFEHGRRPLTNIAHQLGVSYSALRNYTQKRYVCSSAGPRPFKLRESEIPILVDYHDGLITKGVAMDRIGISDKKLFTAACKEHNLLKPIRGRYPRKITEHEIPIFEAYQRGEATISECSVALDTNPDQFVVWADRNGYSRDYASRRRDTHFLNCEHIRSVLSEFEACEISEHDAVKKLNLLVQRVIRKYELRPDPNYKPPEHWLASAVKYRDNELISHREVAADCGITTNQAWTMLSKLGFIRTTSEHQHLHLAIVTRLARTDSIAQELAAEIRSITGMA